MTPSGRGARDALRGTGTRGTRARVCCAGRAHRVGRRNRLLGACWSPRGRGWVWSERGDIRLSETPTDDGRERRRRSIATSVQQTLVFLIANGLTFTRLVFARVRDGGLPAPGEAGVSASTRLDAADGLVVDVEAPRARLPGRPGGELVRLSGEKPGDGLERREEQRASGTAAGRVVRETRRRFVEEQTARGRDAIRWIHGEQANDHRHRAQRNDGKEEDAARVSDPRGTRHGAHIAALVRWRWWLRRGAERRRCRRVVRVRE